MLSWNIPALINKISDDIPAIKGLLSLLLKRSHTDTTDIPAGAKRIQAVTGGVQIQGYANNAWSSVGKLIQNADTLDGKHVSVTATANTIPVRNSNGAVPGDVTGNALTTSEAADLASGYVVPIANGGTGANAASGARSSLGASDASNITAGVLGTYFGGTGRTDGKTTDAYLTDYSTGAVAAGQLGPASQKSGVSADSLTVPGMYICTGCTSALKYPSTDDCFVQVEASGTVSSLSYLIQKATVIATGKEYTRMSSDGGASWDAWASSGSSESEDIHLYVSKGGSDSNSGAVSSSPVLTVGRLMAIAIGCKTTGKIVCHFGPGEWGDLALDGSLLQASSVRATNYPDTQTGTTPIVAEGETVPEGTYFEDLDDNGNFGNEPPHFDSVTASNTVVGFGNVSVDALTFENSDATFSGAVSFCSMSAHRSSIRLASHILRKEDGVTDPVFALDGSHLGISCGANLCKMLNEPTNAKFLTCRNACSLELNDQVNWAGVFAGQKFAFESPVAMYGEATPNLLPGTAGEGSWFSQKTIHSQDGTSALGDVAVAVGASAVTGSLSALNTASSDATSAVISLVHQTDGTKYATAPTPPNGDSSDKIATTEWAAVNSFPAGTRMFFQQSAAPSGWTKETGTGYNDVALRLTTGDIANKTNGKAFTVCMAASRTTTDTTQGGTTGNGTNTGSIGNKALSVAMLAKHRHSTSNGQGSGASHHGLCNTLASGSVATGTSGSGSNHNHGWTGTSHNHTFTGQAHNHYYHMDINYIDFIVAAKA